MTRPAGRWLSHEHQLANKQAASDRLGFWAPLQAYSLACELLGVMAQEPLSMRPETAVELSQLVALLEAPAFAPLRLQLLQPGQHPALLRAVHGLLMLLPQVR